MLAQIEMRRVCLTDECKLALAIGECQGLLVESEGVACFRSERERAER